MVIEAAPGRSSIPESGTVFFGPNAQESKLAEHTDITRERLVREITSSVDIIASNQAPNGLFPAANILRPVNDGPAFDQANHYGEVWIRDNAIVALSLAHVAVLGRFLPEMRKVSAKAQDIYTKNMLGMLDVVAREPWSAAFDQKIEYVRGTDPGDYYTRRTQDPPPVHFRLNGDLCPNLWAQNQPDAWAEMIIAAGRGKKNGIMDFSNQERESLRKINEYLIRINPVTFECSSLWEEAEVRNPPPLSTLLIIGQGLDSGSEFVDDHKYTDKAQRIIDRIENVSSSEFPREFTGPFGHYGQYDLATLVALSLQSPDSSDKLDTYLSLANNELGNGHGKIRYVNDWYWAKRREDGSVEKEALWFMSIPLEATVLFKNSLIKKRHGRLEAAEQTYIKGVKALESALTIGEDLGYYPELWEPTAEGFKPNPNDLLWNRALVLHASSYALEIGRDLNTNRGRRHKNLMQPNAVYEMS